MNAIFSELKKWKVESNPNACAIMFRVFVELSVDVYCEKFQLDRWDINNRLSEKIGAVCEDFKKKKYMSIDQLKPINKACCTKDQLSTVDTFHAYVHNPDMIPQPIALNSHWDLFEPFLKILHEKLLEP